MASPGQDWSIHNIASLWFQLSENDIRYTQLDDLSLRTPTQQTEWRTQKLSSDATLSWAFLQLCKHSTHRWEPILRPDLPENLGYSAQTRRTNHAHCELPVYVPIITMCEFYTMLYLLLIRISICICYLNGYSAAWPVAWTTRFTLGKVPKPKENDSWAMRAANLLMPVGISARAEMRSCCFKLNPERTEQHDLKGRRCRGCNGAHANADKCFQASSSSSSSSLRA